MATQPKFNVGQRVHVRVPHPYGQGAWEWTGAITHVADAGDIGYGPQWEYWVDNNPRLESGEFPLLAWESQLTLATT